MKAGGGSGGDVCGCGKYTESVDLPEKELPETSGLTQIRDFFDGPISVLPC